MTWIDHLDNPLVAPRWWSWIVGDPSVLTPEESGNGFWMFANNVTGIYTYRSNDGFKWTMVNRVDWNGNRPWILKTDKSYFLFYQRFSRLFQKSHLVVRQSENLNTWSKPVPVLRPDLDWEGLNISNACVILLNNKYRLYYSADLVYLKDMGFSEPKNISFAESDSPLGPYVKYGRPILGPGKDLGAGAIKVYQGLMDGFLTGFTNRIFKENGKSSSAIFMARSKDGIYWELSDKPILFPSDNSWKSAHVYQLDVKHVGGDLFMWYNARNGYRFATEKIGLAIHKGSKLDWS